MDLSVFIARILGVVYITVGVGILLNGDHYKKMMTDFVKNTGLMYLGGAMALIVGYLIVSYHNHWVQDWTVLITIIGWIALVKGVLILVAPKAMIEMTKVFTDKIHLATLTALILGAVFIYFGYFG